MNKKITALSIAILMLAVSFVVVGYGNSAGESGITYANIGTYAAQETVSTTESLGEFVSQKVDNVTNIGDIIGDVSDIGNSLGGLMGGMGGSSSGGLGDAIGGIGDALGGLMNGMSGSSSGSSGGSGSVTYDVNTETIGYIDIVPAASEFTPVITTGAVATTAASVNETVDFAASGNPYTKPTGELKGGDKGEGVKWMQWVFIYTRYGLKDDGITGVFDEDTMAVVKKLQKENGLVVDGIVDDEVIDKIELLYFQAIYSTTAPAAVTESTTQAIPTASDSQNTKGSSTAGMVAIVIIIALIWVLAIGAIIVLFVFRKKKGTKKKKTTGAEKTAVAENDTVIDSISGEDGEFTIAEMFEKNE